jgi:hypothetical protein
MRGRPARDDRLVGEPKPYRRPAGSVSGTSRARSFPCGRGSPPRSRHGRRNGPCAIDVRRVGQAAEHALGFGFVPGGLAAACVTTTSLAEVGPHRLHPTPIESAVSTAKTGISTSRNCATGRDRRSARECRPRGWWRTDPSAVGPWPAHTPGRATMSRLPRILGRAIASMRPSPILPRHMQSSTRWTSPRCSGPHGTGRSRWKPAYDDHLGAGFGVCHLPGRGAQLIDSVLRALGSRLQLFSGSLAAGSSPGDDARDLRRGLGRLKAPWQSSWLSCWRATMSLGSRMQRRRLPPIG